MKRSHDVQGNQAFSELLDPKAEQALAFSVSVLVAHIYTSIDIPAVMRMQITHRYL